MTTREASTLRKTAYEQLDPAARKRAGLSLVNTVVAIAILLSVGLAVLETEPTVYARWQSPFEVAELTITALFAAEYVARLWASAEQPGPGSTIRKRLRFIVSLAALVDLAVILAALAPFMGANLALLRVVRLARIARLGRLGHFSRAARHLHYAVSSRAYELLLTGTLALFLLLAGATALYWAEGGIQPDKFGSIPRALWWSAVTLTTIGYGDVSPITPLGKAIAVLVAVAGIGLVAMPTGILAAGFSEAVQRDRRAEEEAVATGRD